MLQGASRVLLAAWFLIFAGCAASAGKRVALVIGNGAYANAPVLANPKNDAEDVAAALKRLGFEETALQDLTVRDFDRAIDAFEAAAKDADVALFFFSGHGVQIDKRGYLAPVDLKAETESAALRELVAIQEVVSRIENAAKVSVIVLDACRDSPLQERIRRVSAEKNKGLIPAKGLPPPSAVGSNTLIVYATVPGETASDGAGRNSPFTASLLKNIETPGLDVELMFKYVTADVLAATRGKQQPERLSRLQTELMLLPGKPDANYAGIARARLDELKKGNLALALPQPKPAPPAIQYEDAEQRLVRTFSDYPSWVHSGVILPRGHTALSGSNDFEMKLWDLDSGRELRGFTGHQDQINTVAISPDGRTALSGSNDKTLMLWDIASGRKLRSFTGHTNYVTSVAISPDGRMALSAGDTTLRLWDVSEWTQPQEARR